MRDVDVDAAEDVHDPDESAEVDLRVVVDRDAGQRAQGAHQDVEAGPVGARELLGMVPCVGDQRVDLVPVLAPVGHRHVDHVARDREHRHGPGRPVQRDDDHRVGQVGVATDAGVDADHQRRDPLAGGIERRATGTGAGRGGGQEARVGRRADGRHDRGRRPDEDLVGGLPGDLGRVAGIRLGSDDEDQEERDRQEVAPARPRQHRIEQAGADRQQPRGQQQRLGGEQAPDHLVRQERGGQPGTRGRRDDPGHGDEAEEQRRDEQEGSPAATGHEMTEARDQGVEDRRDIA